MFGDALKLDPETFQKTYGTSKPAKDAPHVVVYCKAGVRADRAMQAAHAQGYTTVRNYKGSWLEWSQSA